MQYGICPLSIVPLRYSPEESSEMMSQLLFGEHFKILESRKYWSKIRVAYDNCEGWIPNNQLLFISKEEYEAIQNKVKCHTSDLIGYVEHNNSMLTPILLGSSMNNTESLCVKFDGNKLQGMQKKENLVKTALLYLNSPGLNGGRTPFGIDASGLTQMVYKINGYELLRNAEQQATQGEALSFVEESEAGDLAFFDNTNGIIDHVGIIMDNNYIIHVNGTVRIDRIDHTGIFNNDLRNYSHKLRVIKKII
ncbi:C40 family peptidase [Maribacter thermophilus]|uniref:C40 family peptidase n=1 Tax=Maribacter thermophilus TaxID=1197874 RepID=UPI0006412F4A|nr:NlpC/P60 family protein [Maribacter thermophilus]